MGCCRGHLVGAKLVVEVSYDHFTGGRFRHGTTIIRWRSDKKSKQCTTEQLKQKSTDGVAEGGPLRTSPAVLLYKSVSPAGFRE